MTTLTVTRADPRDAQERQVYVKLDGEQIAYLMYGDSVTREISPGRHLLTVNNTLFWKKLEFDALTGEQMRFSIVNYRGQSFWALIGIIGIAPLYLRIDRVDVAAAAQPL